MKLKCAATLALMVTTVGAASAWAADPPALVSSYAGALVRQCGAPGPADGAPAGLVARMDLDGDKVDDWVLDANRHPCPGRPSVAGQPRSGLVTVFRGLANGHAVPAFQTTALGAATRQGRDGRPQIWLTLVGEGCGDPSGTTPCDRMLIWKANEARFALAAASGQPRR